MLTSAQHLTQYSTFVLTTKLGNLGINSSLCNWILSFLTCGPQLVRSGHTCSTSISLHPGLPQGCVLRSFLYSLFIHDCKPVHGSHSILKFADNTKVIGLIMDTNERLQQLSGLALAHLLSKKLTDEAVQARLACALVRSTPEVETVMNDVCELGSTDEWKK